MQRHTRWIWTLIVFAAAGCATLPDSFRAQSPDDDPFAENPSEIGEATLDAPRVSTASTRRTSPRSRISPVEFRAAEPRGPADCPTPFDACPPGSPCAAGPFGRPPGLAAHLEPPACPPPGIMAPISYPRLYPDEYVCDGGDRGYPVHYDDYNRLGFETEDTVAEYVDSDGQFRMKPSTRVCLYAPRFGAMRTLSGLQADTSVHKVASAHENTVGAGLRARDAVSHHSQRTGTDRLRTRSRLSGLDGEAAGVGAHQALKIVSHTKLDNAYEDLQFVRTGRFHVADEARLAGAIQAGMAWTRADNPVVVATTSGLHQVKALFKPMEIVGREDRRTKGDLRIVKLADKKVAKPGDVVTFTLRYDNLGDLPVSHVRIVDNLSPRLEYVDDSATSDRAGEVTTEDNQEGSVILTIELDEPLEGKTGGVITFRATIR